jgi:adenylate cyclase
MGLLRDFIRKPFITIISGGVLAFLLVAGLRYGDLLEVLELAAYDWFIRLVPKQAWENQRITVIEITEKDIKAVGRWPLSDETISRALKVLLRGNPRVIGVDVYRDMPVPPGSNELSRVFIENPRVIGIMTVGDRGIAPLAAIKGTEQAAFGDIVVDPGGIVRRGLLFLDDGRNVFTSFALKMASVYLAAEGVDLRPDPMNPLHVRLRETTLKPFEGDDGGYRNADARGYQFLLDFEEAAKPFRTYSFSDLLSGQVPVEAIANRIVLVGVNAQSVKDHFFTPLSKGFTEGQQVSGIALHGQIAGQLLRFALEGTTPITSPTERQKAGWLLFWSVLGSLIGFTSRSARRFFLFIAGGLLLIILTACIAFTVRWWVPLVPPALAFFLAAGGITAYVTGREKRERAALMQIFSKHVSKEVAEMIWQQRDQFLDNGRPRSQNMTVTVFFSDLKGFTTVSEKMPPKELIDWLNTYMESMAGLIMKYGGVVDSYAGDGIKADFGVPLPRNGDEGIRMDAQNAVACALEMEQEMYRLNEIWGEKGLPEMGVRIGIFTGPVVGGLLGSSQRLKYTTIGDTVNIASRLESYDKEVGKDTLCRILIGDSTLNCLDGCYSSERIGEVSLKGKEQKIIVHRVLDRIAPGADRSYTEVLP